MELPAKWQKLIDIYSQFLDENKDNIDPMEQMATAMLWMADGFKNASKVFRMILSKDWLFVKWLIDTDKIDFKKMYEKVWKPQIIIYAERNKEEELCEIIGENERSYYEDILMLLAIQDSPLEFLADILK